MERYEVHPSDDGRYFILDSVTGLVIAWVGNKSVAKDALKHINRNHQESLSKSS